MIYNLIVKKDQNSVSTRHVNTINYLLKGRSFMARYAKDTNVSIFRSIEEIQKNVERYGASEFGYATRTEEAAIVFTMNNRKIRFVIPMPDKLEFQSTPTGKPRSESVVNTEYEKACRQRWRALNLVIKAKLEAIDIGISEFEEEFLANIMLPGNKSVSEIVLPEIAAAYKSGNTPTILLE